MIEKGNELDCWYPLLPRRISNADINPFNADWEPEEIEDDGYDDIFDTCPECGCGISLRNDGGQKLLNVFLVCRALFDIYCRCFGTAND